ncbi:MAG: formyltransferase family protein [Chlamydiales bacterium]|nr:formyltransferase family protein [Chlamydiales bacterium]
MKKIVIFSTFDLAGNMICNHLLPHLKGYEYQIILSEAHYPLKKQVLPFTCFKFLEQDLVNELLFPLLEVKEFAPLQTWKGLEKKYASCFHMAKTNDLATEHPWIFTYKPDIILSIHSRYLVKESILALPRLGTYNLHSGLLPSYRGLMPTFRALYDDCVEVGSTFHSIDDESIDTGSILGWSRINVRKDKSLLWHELEVYKKAVDLIVEKLPQIASGSVQRIPNKVLPSTYFSFPTNEEFNAFMAKGWKIFDPQEYMDFFQLFKHNK